MCKIFLSVVVFFSFFLGGCSIAPERSCDVVVSIPPYLYFVKALTGDKLKAVSLAPEGSNPHLYEATPKQVQQARQAKVWIRLSESFEVKIAKSLQERNKNLLVVNLAQSPHLSYLYEPNVCSCGHPHAEDRKDLHIWMSLKGAQIQAHLIAQALIEAFPSYKEEIERNLEKLKQDLAFSDQTFAEALKAYQGSSLLVSHPAFGYFCRDYGLKQLSIESEGKDPLPKQLASTLAQAVSSPICAIFTQIQYNNKGAEIIAEELRIRTNEVDPYSADYIENLKKIVNAITKS